MPATYTVLLKKPDYIDEEMVIVYAEATGPEEALKRARRKMADMEDAKADDYELVSIFKGRRKQMEIEGHCPLQFFTENMGDLDRNTILAALRYWQAYLETGEAPTGGRLKAIHDIAEEGGTPAGPEHIDHLCESINS